MGYLLVLPLNLDELASMLFELALALDLQELLLNPCAVPSFLQIRDVQRRMLRLVQHGNKNVQETNTDCNEVMREVLYLRPLGLFATYNDSFGGSGASSIFIASRSSSSVP